MFKMLRTRFGIPGIVSVIALVFAMTGGAFAAKKYIITSTKQIKPSVLKSLKGEEGPRGLAGTNGTNGTNGKDGAQGSAGTHGTDGTDGTNGTVGTDGKNVVTGTATSTPVTGECPEVGGATVEVEGNAASKKKVCNGSPWTVGGTLPSKETETGTWSVLIGPTGNGLGDVSFPIPLGAEIPPANVLKVLAGGSVPAVCDDAAGSPPSVANPEADPGYLCVFVSGFIAGGSVKYIWKPDTTSASTDTGAGTTGALLIGTSSGEDVGTGTFAVTAP